MEIGDAATIIGSLFAGLSVFWAVIEFQKNANRELFGRLRLSLVDLRFNLERLDRLLSQASFSEVSSNIVGKLKMQFSKDVTKEKFVSYMTNKDHRNYIMLAVVQGHSQSPCVKEVRNMCSSISRMVYEYQEDLPILAAIIERLTRYIEQTAEAVLLPDSFEELLTDPELLKKAIIDDIADCDAANPGPIFHETIVALTSGATLLMEKQGQPVYDACKALIDILISAFAPLSDAEMKKQRAKQLRSKPNIIGINTKTNVEDAFLLFQNIRTSFTNEDWDRIVELKTKLFQVAHEYPKKE